MEACFARLAQIAASGKKSASKDALKAVMSDDAVLADPETGNTVMHMAAHTQNTGLLELLHGLETETPVEAIGVDVQNCDGTTPLMLAVHANSLDTVRALLGVGANVHVGDHLGQRPVYMAAALGYADICDELQSRYDGRQALERTKYDRLSPLHAACLGGHSSVVQVLLAGAKVDIHETSGTMAAPLFCAVLGGNLDVIRALFEAGVDPEATANNGTTVNDLITALPEDDALRTGYAAILEEVALVSHQQRAQETMKKKMKLILKDEEIFIAGANQVRNDFVTPFSRSTLKNMPLSQHECEQFAMVGQRLDSLVNTRRMFYATLSAIVSEFSGAETLDAIAEHVRTSLMNNASFTTIMQRYVMAVFPAMAPLNAVTVAKLSKAIGMGFELSNIEETLKFPLVGISLYIELLEALLAEAVTVFSLPENCSPAYDSVLADMRAEHVSLLNIVEKLENQYVCGRVQASLLGTFDNIVDPNRQLIRQGYLTKSPGSGSGRNQRRFWFLFSDILIYASPPKKKTGQYEFKGRVDLFSTALKDIPDGSGYRNAFEIISKRGNFTIYADSLEEKRSWFRAIANTSKAFQTHTLDTLDEDDEEIRGSFRSNTLESDLVSVDSDEVSMESGAPSRTASESHNTNQKAAIAAAAAAGAAGGAAAGVAASSGAAGAAGGAGAAGEPAPMASPTVEGTESPAPAAAANTQGNDTATAELQARLRQAKHDNDALTTDLATAHARIASLEADAASNAAKVGELLHDNNELRAQVEALTKELAETKEALEKEKRDAETAREAAKAAASAAASAAEQAAMLASMSEEHAAAEAADTQAAVAPVAAPARSEERLATEQRVDATVQALGVAVDRMGSWMTNEVDILKADLKEIVDAIKHLQLEMTTNKLEATTIEYVQAAKAVLMAPLDQKARGGLSLAGDKLLSITDHTVAAWKKE